MPRFLDDYTKEELIPHFNRFAKHHYHTEKGEIIVDRKIYEKDKKTTNKNFNERILNENMDLYGRNASPVNEPTLYGDCNLNDYKLDKYPKGFLDKMKKRAINGDSFYLMGTHGSGKSRFAWAYAKHLYLTLGYRDIVIVRFSDVFKHCKMEYGAFVQDDRFKRFMTCKTLILDDVRCMAGKNVNQYDAFVDLLDSRLEGEGVTCFTSNIGYNSLAGDEIASERVASRIERILETRSNIEIFKNKFKEF